MTTCVYAFLFPFQRQDKVFYLRAEPHPAAADDAGEGEASPVRRDVLLQPGERAGALAEDLASRPEAAVGGLALGGGGLLLADLTDDVTRLRERNN